MNSANNLLLKYYPSKENSKNIDHENTPSRIAPAHEWNVSIMTKEKNA
jgi:hypothetical protein